MQSMLLGMKLVCALGNFFSSKNGDIFTFLGISEKVGAMGFLMFFVFLLDLMVPFIIS